jgi:hypothetical protein
LLIIVVLNRLFSKNLSKNKPIDIKISQSYLYKFLAEYEKFDIEPLPKQQSLEYLKRQYVKVMIVEQEAYWIKDNQLYVANVVDDEVDSSTTRQVDTISMDKVELEKTMFVVQKLTEGKDNDFGGPGKQ